MTLYADTSFLASLYLRDVHFVAARGYLARHRTALQFTSLHSFELLNAIRLLVFRGNVAPKTGRAAIAKIKEDLDRGDLEATALIWPEVLEIAEEISEKHTVNLGVRSLDLLHVAAAASLDATVFLTFDERQHAVAKATGMRVGP